MIQYSVLIEKVLNQFSILINTLYYLTESNVIFQVFAAYVLCTAQDKDAVRLTLEQIDVIRRMCTEYPELELATTAAGI